MSKKNTHIVYAFIDSQNLNLGIRDSGWILDFEKFRIYLKDKLNVKNAYLFIGKIGANEKLYKYLEKSDYLLVFKPTLEYKKNQKRITKGNVDKDIQY